MTKDNSCEGAPMSEEEVVETLKTMVFEAQAFERFNAKEREALDKAWNIISRTLEQDKNVTIDKIQAELIQSIRNGTIKIEDGNEELFRIINKYKRKSEDKE